MAGLIGWQSLGSPALKWYYYLYAASPLIGSRFVEAQVRRTEEASAGGASDQDKYNCLYYASALYLTVVGARC